MRSPERQFNALTPDQEKQSEAPKAPEASVGKIPIAETETAVSYLGVTLEKAKISDSPFVPKREKYADYINDKDFALPFQRDLATAFLNGDPYLGEGGTSLGKTTTAKKMAAELGWEVHYANFNGATDVEDFMGRYIPNPFKIDRTKITDEQYQKIVKQWRAHTAEMDSTALEAKEYIFADGKVTSGLRQEEGKIKVIILDEINAASPNILIRLHEVLDVLERGGDLVLSEDASEAVAVDKNKTKIVAFMNPPGKEYIGLGSLSPAQLRRWVYQKLPSELPDEAFKYATKSLFFGEKEKLSQKIDPEIFLQSREQVLTEEQLEEIPGIHEVEEKFEEFHKAAKELLKNRKIAEDQPQPLTYDDRMEPRRVRDFVLRFYNGDVSETFQRALQYYYANKLESDADREKLGELIRLVEYKPKAAESKRKGPERKTKEEPKKKPETGPETRLEGAVAERKEAEEMGLGEKTETDPEFLERFEKKSLNYIERLLSQGADQAYVAQGLAGLDSDRAWAIREKLLSEDADKNHVAQGLAGLDSDRAWTMREELLAQGADKGWVAAGLAGLDSDRAWAIREKLLSEDADKNHVARGLAGLDSDRAWTMREELLAQGADKGWVAAGLAGLDSDRAWAIREKLLSEDADKNHVAQGLAGLDSDRAWTMREELLAQGADKGWVAAGLAGLDSDRAWAIREKLLSQDAHKGLVAEGLAGTHITFVWRKKYE